MDTNTIVALATAIVTFVCGLIAKKHPKISNKLIPVQNLAIGLVVAFVYFLISKNFETAILVSGLLAGGTYDLGKNLLEIVNNK